MGVSTDAILLYGYCWDDEGDPWRSDDGEEVPGNEDDGWETRYARAKGCLPPKEPYSAAEQTIIDQHRAYWEAKDRIAKASPCLVGTHCSASCPMAYVAVSASLTISRRGSPREVTSLAVDPAWDDQLVEFCAALGIKTEGKKAAWWLVSDWGE